MAYYDLCNFDYDPRDIEVCPKCEDNMEYDHSGEYLECPECKYIKEVEAH